MGQFKYIQNEDLSIEKVYIEDEVDFENQLKIEEILQASEDAAVARLEADEAMLMADLPESAERTAMLDDFEVKRQDFADKKASRETKKTEILDKIKKEKEKAK